MPGIFWKHMSGIADSPRSAQRLQTSHRFNFLLQVEYSGCPSESGAPRRPPACASTPPSCSERRHSPPGAEKQVPQQEGKKEEEKAGKKTACPSGGRISSSRVGVSFFDLPKKHSVAGRHSPQGAPARDPPDRRPHEDT